MCPAPGLGRWYQLCCKRGRTQRPPGTIRTSSRSDDAATLRVLDRRHQLTQHGHRVRVGERVQADTVRALEAIVNAAREASELRAIVPVFKDLLKSGLRDRVGVASYKRLAELLDGHDKGNLA